MSILVDGGTGFIGAHICRGLAEQGETVVALDIAPRIIDFLKLDNVKIVKGDITDITEILHIIKKFQVERVVSTAAVVGETPAKPRPMLAFKLNVGGIINMLEAARIMDLKRVIWFSTCGVYRYRMTREAITEDETPSPHGLYGTTKVMGEMMGTKYYEKYGVEFAALRPPFVYGPLERFQSVVSLFLTEALAGRSFGTKSGGDQLMDLVYVKDVADGAILAAKASSLKHRIYNIGSGEPHTLSEVAEIVKKIVPTASIELGPGLMEKDTFSFVPEEEGLHLHGNRDFRIEIKRAQDDFNYCPKYSLEKGVKDYFEWMKAEMKL